MTPTEEIKSRLPARQVLEFYGLTVDRAGFCKSPFSSNDKTPSLKVYDGDRGWHDFSSGKGGDIIDFVMLYFGLPFQAAQEKLNADFALGLPIGETLTPAQRAQISADARARREATKERERRRSALAEAVDRALSAFVLADKVCPVRISQALASPLAGRALAQRDAAWYNLCEAEKNLADFEKKR